MKIILPHKISSEIFDVIYNAKEKLVIVSPYVDFWIRLSSDLTSAMKRGVKIDFFTRHDVNNIRSWEQIEGLGILPRLIPNLHAKLYFNETSGVISSMNLLSSSNANSIEIGCKIDTSEELEELKLFVNNFLVSNEVSEKPSPDDNYLSKEKFSEVLANYTGTTVYYKSGGFNVVTRWETHNLLIDKVENRVTLKSILSGKQADQYASKGPNYFNSNYFDYQLINGSEGNYDQLIAHSKVKLSNSFLDKLLVREKKVLLEEIGNLLEKVYEFKNACN